MQIITLLAINNILVLLVVKKKFLAKSLKTKKYVESAKNFYRLSTYYFTVNNE